MVKRLDVTEKALEVIKTLKEKHGDLMFYQAGGAAKEPNLNVLKKEVST